MKAGKGVVRICRACGGEYRGLVCQVCHPRRRRKAEAEVKVKAEAEVEAEVEGIDMYGIIDDDSAG